MLIQITLLSIKFVVRFFSTFFQKWLLLFLPKKVCVDATLMMVMPNYMSCLINPFPNILNYVLYHSNKQNCFFLSPNAIPKGNAELLSCSSKLTSCHHQLKMTSKNVEGYALCISLKGGSLQAHLFTCSYISKKETDAYDRWFWAHGFWNWWIS